MICQKLFSGNNKKNISLSSVELVQRVVRVNRAKKSQDFIFFFFFFILSVCVLCSKLSIFKSYFSFQAREYQINIKYNKK